MGASTDYLPAVAKSYKSTAPTGAEAKRKKQHRSCCCPRQRDSPTTWDKLWSLVRAMQDVTCVVGAGGVTIAAYYAPTDRCMCFYLLRSRFCLFCREMSRAGTCPRISFVRFSPLRKADPADGRAILSRPGGNGSLGYDIIASM